MANPIKARLEAADALDRRRQTQIENQKRIITRLATHNMELRDTLRRLVTAVVEDPEDTEGALLAAQEMLDD